MRNTEEKIRIMHKRAAAIKRKEDRFRLRVLGSLSGCLLVCLIVMVQKLGGLQHDVLIGQTTGSSLLDDGTGGYVLAAVIAFIAGVIITAMIYKWKNKAQR
ncbi:MAG: hypothetical protein IJH22_06865 [Firmicutes bacterium]|nr:hypothetical protein [Bacillota bacterium]